jgi:hypothetical protein
MRRLFLLVGTSLLLSCGQMLSPAVINNSMTFDQLGALQCKTTVQRLLEAGRDQTVSEEDAENSPSCPVAQTRTYADSLRQSVGKPWSQATIVCQGEHHQAAGCPRDYPRHEPGKGIVDSEQGIHVPTCFAVILPEDARVVSTGANGSTATLSFTTAQDLKELAEGYHKMLNMGRERVLAGDSVDSGVVGKAGGIDYQMTFDKKAGQVNVSWSPPLVKTPQQ